MSNKQLLTKVEGLEQTVETMKKEHMAAYKGGMKMQQRDADSSIESISSDDEDLTALTNKRVKAPPTKVAMESHLLNSSEEISFIREKTSP